MDIVWIVVLIVHALVCACLSTNLAQKKGHSEAAWFCCGFFLGLLGLIAAAGLPTRQPAEVVSFKKRQRLEYGGKFARSDGRWRGRLHAGVPPSTRIARKWQRPRRRWSFQPTRNDRRVAEHLASASASTRPQPGTCLNAANEPSVHPAQPSYRGGDQGRQQWRLYTLSPTPSDLTKPVHGTGGIH